MDLQHEFDVAASIEDAWSAFLDMPRIAPCMPGAEVTEVIDERNVKGGAKVKVGPVNLRFSGAAEMTEIDPVNHSAQLKAGGADAKGRGNADADVRFTLTEAGESSTHVEVSTILNLTGSVAQYGRVSGLIDEIANQLIGEFVTNLEAELGVDADAGASDAVPGADAEGLAPAATSPPKTSPPETTPASGLKLLFKALLSMIKKQISMIKKRFARS
jgi:carbon monoxide dehydrogenase subunit G